MLKMLKDKDRGWRWAGELFHYVKAPGATHEDLSSNPQNPHKTRLSSMHL